SGSEHGLSIGLSGTRSFDGMSCPIELKNVRFLRIGTAQEGRVSRGGILTADRCSFLGLHLRPTPGAAMTLNRCVVTTDIQTPLPAEAADQGADARALQNLADKAAAVLKQWQKLEQGE
ncbi:MAG: hypothetical protein JWO94_3496, partial [Verrucomicrobiaceae bacterium]|nr:hypothetical protein [Verrucomicrobiaceae bacterium]